MQRSVGPNSVPFKAAVVGCPKRFPKVMSGGPLLDPAPGPDAVYSIINNNAIGNMGWVVSAQRYFGGRSTWKLSVEAICTK